MIVYRDRAYCTRSLLPRHGPGELEPCANTQCDRFADRHVIAQADKAKLPIGWADLQTSKCGFVPREGE